MTLVTWAARGVGHRAGDGPVQRPQHDRGGGIGARPVGLEPGADEVGVEVGGGRVVGDLPRTRNGLVVVEHADGPGVRCGGLDGVGQAGAYVGQIARQLRRHRPVVDTGPPDADADTGDPGQLELQTGGEADVVCPVLQQDQLGRVLGQVRRRQLVDQIAGLLRRDRALPVPGRVVRGVGHGAADGELVPDELAVGGPHRHGQPEFPGHLGRVGGRRGALRHPGRREPHLGREIGVVQPVAVGNGVAQRDGAGRRRDRWRRRAGAPGDQHDDTGDQCEHDHGSDEPEHGERRAAAPQVCSLPMEWNLTNRCRTAAEVRLYRPRSARWQQEEAAVVAAEAEGVGEDGGGLP